jgi:EAL domain-containing protein (putative c-di-GMP-specific phosphodiesterase class I)
LGCGIDLDDFGTGYASITNIERFSVGRIKIDRSFVTGIDSDPEQKNMVAAILNMADRRGASTLAEGIEKRSERDTFLALGCEDAQGFHFARPMPIQETVE